MGGAGAGAGAGLGGFGGAPADTRPPSEKWASQLETIKGMGFNDDETILAMLE